MFKFDRSKTGHRYVESPQKNPMLWEMLWKNEEGVLVPQAGKMRCKDFFNDVVSAYNNGPKEPIYGFDVSKILLNEEGQYVRLFNIEESFYDNMNNTVIPELKKDLGVDLSLWKLEKNQALLFIPRECYNSTYIISWLTQLIRVCNYPQFPNIKTMVELDNTMMRVEHRMRTRNWGFSVPEKYRDYWWYFNENANSKKSFNIYISCIHGNGWSNFAYGVR